jgi:hypothetical protein
VFANFVESSTVGWITRKSRSAPAAAVETQTAHRPNIYTTIKEKVGMEKLPQVELA